MQQVAERLPWFLHVILMERMKAPEERTFYIQMTIKNGWSGNILAMQNDSHLYARQGKVLRNLLAGPLDEIYSYILYRALFPAKAGVSTLSRQRKIRQ